MDNTNPQPPQSQLTPDVFKQRVMAAHPEYAQAKASDGTPYASMDSTDFTQRFVQKYPDAVTSDGHKYSDFLPQSNTPLADAGAKSGLFNKIVNGGVGVLNSIEKPLVGLAALPVQAGVAAYNKVTGSNVADPYANGLPGLNGSSVPVSKLGLEQKLGDATQVASYAIPGEGILGAAAMGATQGIGSAMSDGQDLANVATQGALGGIVGGATGGLFKYGGGLLQRAGDVVSGKAAQDATNGIRDAYSSALNLNASQRAFESRSGKDLAQVLVDNGAPLGKYEDGTLDASKAIPKLQAALDPLNAQAKAMVSSPQGLVGSVSIPDVFDQTIQAIKSKNLTPIEEGNAIQHATEQFNGAANRYGTNDLTPAQAEEFKQSLQGSVFKKGKLIAPQDMTRGNVDYLASDVLKKNVEDSMAGTDAEGDYQDLNKRRSDLIDSIKRLQTLDGVTKVKGGRLGNMMGGMVGTVAGAASGLGPLGALGGDYFGSRAADFLQNPENVINIAKGKAQAAGIIPNFLGNKAQTIGDAISSGGNAVRKSARPAGLLANLLTQGR